MPHGSTRARVARLLEHDETYSWPQLHNASESKNATQAELVQIWPTRNAVPAEVHSLFRQVEKHLDVLVYSGGFLVETFDLVGVVRDKAAGGALVRILLGDSRCDAVRSRGREEGLPTPPQRCASTLEYLAEVAHADGVEIRTHQTPLYASQFRFDDSMLVKPHTFGSFAARPICPRWPALTLPGAPSRPAHYGLQAEQPWLSCSARTVQGGPVGLSFMAPMAAAL